MAFSLGLRQISLFQVNYSLLHFSLYCIPPNHYFYINENMLVLIFSIAVSMI